MLICIDSAVIRISLYGELWKINILILILILNPNTLFPGLLALYFASLLNLILSHLPWPTC